MGILFWNLLFLKGIVVLLSEKVLQTGMGMVQKCAEPSFMAICLLALPAPRKYKLTTKLVLLNCIRMTALIPKKHGDF